MLPLRYRWYWLGAGVVILGAILALALLPSPVRTVFVMQDKAMHLAAFAVLAVYFMGIFELRLGWALAALLLGYGLLIELLQAFLPWRMADPFDVVSDLIGIGAGWLLASVGLHRWCGRVEAWLGVVPSGE